uniref:Reverse transcriptase domain-containing protein n=1 Tax=Ananas comosus var. bracteatus TaxID=296719 RepID=A0A6V7PKB6_ANACO|nr:unnamed protein product [Ananas comosus var. bracteatus]
MQGVQKALRTWSSGLTSSIKTQTSLCLHWLNWLDIAEEGRALSILECKLRPLLKGRYEELCLQEEIKWRQRSKVQWIRAGDANTKFFHMRANGRRNKNFISRIMDGDAVLSTPGSISDHLSSFFRIHLGVQQTDPDLIIDLHFLYRDDNIDLSNLLSAFSMEEVKEAISSSAPEKSPGPDGFPMMFYLRFWATLKDDIMEVFNRFHSDSVDLKEINTSWVCPIPKKPDVVSVRDLRPISLIHGLAKIISKVLAKRLQCFMARLINPHQTAFIKGRNILDSFFTAHILVHHLQSSKSQATIFKIDFERAFDHINWNFLLAILRARGFDHLWISWISNLLHSSSTAVLFNRIPGTSFSCKRGLRQGDPLSPLLFILCVDVLFRMLQLAVNSHLLPAIGIGEAKIHTLQFADDILIFFDGSSRSAAVIKVILDAFSSSSGLKINFNKSSLIPINLSSEQTRLLTNVFACPIQDFPIKYLGLPLSPKRLRKSDYLALIEKIDNRLAGWKGNLLLRGVDSFLSIRYSLLSLPIFVQLTCSPLGS